MRKTQRDQGRPIEAAGGILKLQDGTEIKIALVHRRRYGGEIGLPKGKVNDDDNGDLVAAALREVKEETGCDAEIIEFAGRIHYSVGRRPKTVTYFLMNVSDISQTTPQDTEEVASVEWMTPEKAVKALTHDEDRDLVRALFGLPRA
jgi:8-oxo-dGTP pyrophosphatase MutT (NUDIX family)